MPSVNSPITERITRLLASAKRAQSAGQTQSAIELLQTVIQLDPSHTGAQQLIAALSGDGSEDVGESSVAWNVQYAAGADESIDEPPPLALDIFDSDSESLDDSFISGSYQSQPEPTMLGGASMNNPSTDPYRMQAKKFSTAMNAPEERSGLLEPASSKVVTLKSLPSVSRKDLEEEWEVADSKMSASVERDLPSERDVVSSGASSTSEHNSDEEPLVETLSERDGYRVESSRSGPVFFIDTFDEEVDDDDVEGVDERLQLAVRRHDAGDYAASQALVERILEIYPQHAVAERLGAENRRQIQIGQASKLGSLNHCPRVKLRQQEVVWQSLNHHEGFMISLVDGQTPYESIIEISAMPKDEAIKILSRLVELGVIG